MASKAASRISRLSAHVAAAAGLCDVKEISAHVALVSIPLVRKHRTGRAPCLQEKPEPVALALALRIHAYPSSSAKNSATRAKGFTESNAYQWPIGAGMPRRLSVT